ncbi:MAG: hypothetical protein AB7O43_16505 [Hyphomicrobiaceae bacterium]
MSDATNVLPVVRALRRIWRASRVLSLISGLFAISFLFLAVMIVAYGKSLSPREIGLVIAPSAVFAYFHSVTGNHGVRFRVLGVIIFLLALADAVVSTDVTLHIKRNATFENYARMIASWLFLALIALPALIASFRLARPTQAGLDIPYLRAVAAVNQLKRTDSSGAIFRSGRKPILGLALGAASGCILLLVPFSMWQAPKLGLNPWVCFFVLLAPCILGARYAFRTSQALLAPEAIGFLEKDPRPPVLLLRSFEDDIAAVKPKNIWLALLWQKLRLEEAAAPELRSLGPFIAIGKPGESLPTLGALRSYLSDEHWQEQVREWMCGARLIVMVPGTTKWVAWELQELVTLGFLSKLMLIFPQESDELLRRRLRFIEDVAKKTTGADLNVDSITTHGLLLCFFDEDGRPRLIYGNRGDQVEYEAALNWAIYALSQRAVPVSIGETI